MAASTPPLFSFRNTCHKCTLQVCKRSGQMVERRGLVCEHPGCPVLNLPSVFKSWWMRAFLFLVLVAGGTGVARQMEARRREANRPRVVSLTSHADTWRGQPWEAFVKAEGAGTLTYQWYSGFPGDVSVPVPDAEEATLRIPDLQAAGRYWARVSSEHGAADSTGVEVAPRTMDVKDHRAELDELFSLARGMMEQRDNLRVIEETYYGLGTEKSLNEEERRWRDGMLINSTRKAQEAATMLINKLGRLQEKASTEVINQLLHDTRPVKQAMTSPEEERKRKAFDLIETLWRTLRDGGQISDKLAIEIANTKLPL